MWGTDKEAPQYRPVWLSRSYHRRVKAATRAVIGVCIVSCVLFDWDTYLGTDRHVFKGLRTGIRRSLDALYGLGPEEAATAAQTQRQARGDDV